MSASPWLTMNRGRLKEAYYLLRYGAGPAALQAKMGLSVEEARQMHEDFHYCYPELRELWLDRTKEDPKVKKIKDDDELRNELREALAELGREWRLLLDELRGMRCVDVLLMYAALILAGAPAWAWVGLAGVLLWTRPGARSG